MIDTFISISSSIYDKINKKTHQQLRNKLDELILKYFLDNNN